jgi:xanthine dehydrogenase YagS FAD-binding subunit
MRPFQYEHPTSIAAALKLGAATDRGPVDAHTQYLAGGTTLIDLMKLDVMRPKRLVDLNGAKPSNEVVVLADRVRLSAFASMAGVADNPHIRSQFPVIAQSLDLAASAQLRNMATLGGNVLQRTRCPYFRDTTWAACNKRNPGSGCTALTSPNRNHAILGIDSSCISQYPGDFATALIALDATVNVRGRSGLRNIPFSALHRAAEGHPEWETTLEPGDIIIDFEIPASPWSARSLYLKVRDRASYEFAIASVAVALDLAGDTVREVRLSLGGMAYRPWRARAAEEQLKGQPLTEQAAEAAANLALRGAVTHGHNDYKPQLARATIVRALLYAKDLSVPVHSA